eukprot:PhM_4_TR3584/c0_g2_i1/m.97488/K06125/COQ2; 4-hydroxybenzoate polyprenyltransferase
MFRPYRLLFAAMNSGGGPLSRGAKRGSSRGLSRMARQQNASASATDGVTRSSAKAPSVFSHFSHVNESQQEQEHVLKAAAAMDASMKSPSSSSSDHVAGSDTTTAVVPCRWLSTDFFVQWSRLIRFSAPTGTLLLLLPCYMGSALGITRAIVLHGADWASVGAFFLPPHIIFWFGFGAFTMRSAGCIVNDMADRKFDRQVERTVSRPLASGALTMTQASFMLFTHLTLGLVVVSALHPMALATAMASVPIAFLYPLAKRYTHLPQFVLGMAFNWGVFVGYAAVLGTVDLTVTVPLWLSLICWTVVYDTVYAFQDIKDDEKVGVKSFARYINGEKRHLYLFLMPICVGLIGTGLAAHVASPYYIGVGVSMFYLFGLLDDLAERDKWSCANFFRRNVRVGILFFLSFVFGNLGWVGFIVWNRIVEEEEERERQKEKENAEDGKKENGTEEKDPEMSVEDASPVKLSWRNRILASMTVSTQEAARSIARTQAVENPNAHIDLLDRMLKPSFSFLQQHPNLLAKEKTVDIIPPYYRQEHFAQNVTGGLELAGYLSAEEARRWRDVYYASSDHYNWFSRGF